MFRVVLAGSVNSSFATLKKLHEHGFEIAGVLGYEPGDSSNVSGYVNMREYCLLNGISYIPFEKINDDKIKSTLTELAPDLFFVVGLSQIVSKEILAVARLGNIGFHPTCLPRGRGRAPIAWLILEEKTGAANFFLMCEGVDDGPLFVQEPFDVEDDDDAGRIEQKILNAIDKALDNWLPALKSGTWNPVPQDDSMATYYAKRSPDDGFIDWNKSATSLNKLIHASSHPHPGAYTFLNEKKLVIWNSRTEYDHNIKGVAGSVLLKDGQKALIQTGNGLLWIWNIMCEGQPRELRIGQRLGFYAELEIYNLKQELNEIKKHLGI